MAEREHKFLDPYSMERCNYLLCEHPSQIACPVCGWTYCLDHWDARMHAVHARNHAKQEMLSMRRRAVR